MRTGVSALNRRGDALARRMHRAPHIPKRPNAVGAFPPKPASPAKAAPTFFFEP